MPLQASITVDITTPPSRPSPPPPQINIHCRRRSGAVLYGFCGHDTDAHYTRVATAASWRTFSHEGKLTWLVRVGGARPPPLITFTITSKVAVYAPAEWADTLTLFHLRKICTL
jgi:hypothetical protein